jgi:hypothetical protein
MAQFYIDKPPHNKSKGGGWATTIHHKQPVCTVTDTNPVGCDNLASGRIGRQCARLYETVIGVG